ncbi:hypothetical protein ACQPZA_13630 [Pseudonocardia xinjiangensis]|uniref:hypothetical protein n=1 Tax=Pseudonocardia xinjiangensis TaxID=75289 RepID=UPI003D8EDA39
MAGGRPGGQIHAATRAGPDGHIHRRDQECRAEPHRATTSDRRRRGSGGPEPGQLRQARRRSRPLPGADFQRELVETIGSWEDPPADARGRGEHYEYLVAALGNLVQAKGMLEDGYVNPEDRDEDHADDHG